MASSRTMIKFPSELELKDHCSKASSSRIAEDQLYKTKMCSLWEQGRCTRRVCRFAHGEDDLREAPSFDRTKMCPMMRGARRCNDPRCRYAHASEELRSTTQMFKSTTCKYFAVGKCHAGERCRHAHSLDELRAPGKDVMSRETSEGSTMDGDTECGSDDAASVSSMSSMRSESPYRSPMQRAYRTTPPSANEKGPAAPLQVTPKPMAAASLALPTVAFFPACPPMQSFVAPCANAPTAPVAVSPRPAPASLWLSMMGPSAMGAMGVPGSIVMERDLRERCARLLEAAMPECYED